MLTDGRLPFRISYQPVHQVFRAHALDSVRDKWVLVEVSTEFNALFTKCAGRGMAFDGATEEAHRLSDGS